MTVKSDEYLEKLVEYSNLKLYAIASVNETRQTWTDEDDFEVLKPKIDIRVCNLIFLCLFVKCNYLDSKGNSYRKTHFYHSSFCKSVEKDFNKL